MEFISLAKIAMVFGVSQHSILRHAQFAGLDVKALMPHVNVQGDGAPPHAFSLT